MITVTTRASTGEGSFRRALLDSNADGGPSRIVFAIPGGGLQVIVPTSPLPRIVEPLEIDGYTQEGARMNSLPTRTNARLRIVIFGGRFASGSTPGLVIAAPDITISGLVVNRFGGPQIHFEPGSTGGVVWGNFIGTDRTGKKSVLTRQGRGSVGIRVSGDSVEIGGQEIERRNLISANKGTGVVASAAAQDTLIHGNLIGTNAAGTESLGNRGGISLNGATGAQVGRGNLIALNRGWGVRVAGGSDNLIQRNYIFQNRGAGVQVTRGTSNTIRYNRLYRNGGLGIDLARRGSNPNDRKDPDLGANERQNFPEIGRVRFSGSTTIVRGRLNSVPGEEYTIDLYRSGGTRRTSEARGHLGEVAVTTRANGWKRFRIAVQGRWTGNWLRATATRTSTGDTSELGPAKRAP